MVEPFLRSLIAAVNPFSVRPASFKILALCFLLIIGMSLVAEGLHFAIPKGYIYFSMAFAVLVELLNLKAKGKKEKRKVEINRPA